MHGELVFDIAWCCQPHRMGNGLHLNLKWIWMDRFVVADFTQTSQGYFTCTWAVLQFPSDSKVILNNIGKCIMWIKQQLIIWSQHNKTMYIYIYVYCSRMPSSLPTRWLIKYHIRCLMVRSCLKSGRSVFRVIKPPWNLAGIHSIHLIYFKPVLCNVFCGVI